jgi:hypothetical protein
LGELIIVVWSVHDLESGYLIICFSRIDLQIKIFVGYFVSKVWLSRKMKDGQLRLLDLRTFRIGQKKMVRSEPSGIVKDSILSHHLSQPQLSKLIGWTHSFSPPNQISESDNSVFNFPFYEKFESESLWFLKYKTISKLTVLWIEFTATHSLLELYSKPNKMETCKSVSFISLKKDSLVIWPIWYGPYHMNYSTWRGRHRAKLIKIRLIFFLWNFEIFYPDEFTEFFIAE